MDELYDHVIVYRALSPEDANAAIDLLVGQDLHPVPLDFPSGAMRLITIGMIRIRIAVPEDEAERAAEVLAAWHAETEPVARDLAHRFERQAVAFLVVAVILGVPIWLATRHWPHLPWGSLILGAAAVVFVVLYVIGHRGEKGV